jgi:hypothetical protein
MAKLAAPYCHARVNAVEQNTNHQVRFVVELPKVCASTDEWLELYAPKSIEHLPAPLQSDIFRAGLNGGSSDG